MLPDGMCQKITDSPACPTGFTFNSTTGKCVTTTRTAAPCTPPSVIPSGFTLESVNSGVVITSITINEIAPSAINATHYSFPLTANSGSYEAHPPTINGTTPIQFTNPTAVMFHFTWGPPTGIQAVLNVNINGNYTYILIPYGLPIYTLSLPNITNNDIIYILFNGV